MRSAKPQGRTGEEAETEAAQGSAEPAAGTAATMAPDSATDSAPATAGYVPAPPSVLLLTQEEQATADSGAASAALETTSQEPWIFEQDFSRLDEAIRDDIWEVDGEDCDLFTCKDGDSDGPAGALVDNKGGTASTIEMVHMLRNGAGARVSELSARLVCESVDKDTAGTFTICLAFDEDYEESSLLALTLRRPRENPGDELVNEGKGPQPEKTVGIQMNGIDVLPNVGKLPVLLEFRASLCWNPQGRRVCLRYRAARGSESSGQCKLSCLEEDAEWAEAEAGFYTTGVNFEAAKALVIRCTGHVRIRLVDIVCTEEDCRGNQAAPTESTTRSLDVTAAEAAAGERPTSTPAADAAV
eukprot:TRINITY_DN15609_c0_g1_i1.p1 TRINITY_DN15609_c0_g1~~TRINITY_DN15609_c0_g1_i1.p1  ORF type:complete len:357 (+),score=72.04 TRINITY_DN15609_c0_g1_i1:1526-2596(+)